MKKITLLLYILKTEVLHPAFLLWSSFFAFAFIFLSFSLLSYKSFLSILASNYSVLSKIKIIFIILLGSFSAMGTLDSFLLVVSAFLFGFNVALLIKRVFYLKKQKNIGLTFGSGIISIAAAGCASCGLSVASIVGVAGALTLLPFGGAELYFLSIAVLLFSLFYNLNTFSKECRIL